MRMLSRSRFEPVAGEALLDPGDDVALHPLGLGQRQAAGRQGRAGERPTLGRQHVLGEPHAVRAQDRGDRVAVRGADFAQDDVLARHQDRVAAEAR